jgi:hypothetical protein
MLPDFALMVMALSPQGDFLLRRSARDFNEQRFQVSVPLDTLFELIPRFGSNSATLLAQLPQLLRNSSPERDQALF